MTRAHKIRLIFSRLWWWLRITNSARRHKRALDDYYYLYDLYNKKTIEFLVEQKKKYLGEKAQRLKGQVELLAEILDIRQ